MIFMLIITLAMMGYSIIDYKKAVYVTSCIFLVETHLTSGIEGVKSFYLISLFQMILFFAKNGKEFSKVKYPMLLLVPCLIASVGYIISSYYGVMKAYSQNIITSLCTFIYPIVLFKVIKTKKDLKEYLMVLFSFFFVVGVYTIIEAVTHYNPYSNFVQTYDLGEGYYGGYTDKIRFGIRRCNSLFAFCSTLGMLSAFTFFIVLYLKLRKIEINSILENLLLVLMPLCVVLTGTRSQYIVFCVALFPFFFWYKAYRSVTFKLSVIVGFICIIAFSAFWGDVLDSIFNSNDSSGSSADMREGQFEISLFYMKKSFIWGFGKGYIQKYVIPYNPALYGAESIWFRQMIDYGIVGCVTYLAMCLCSLIWIYRYDKRFAFIPLAFLVGKSISIVIGVEVSYLLVTCIVLQKIAVLYNLKSSKDEYIKYTQLLRMRSLRSVVQQENH